MATHAAMLSKCCRGGSDGNLYLNNQVVGSPSTLRWLNTWHVGRPHALSQIPTDLWSNVFRMNQLPWDENWTLDERFFKDMETWRAQGTNPDSTLLKVMEKQSQRTYNLQTLYNCARCTIPSSWTRQGPRPVTSAWNTAARAKNEVFEFTQSDNLGGKLEPIVHNNLMHIRS